MVTDIPNSSPLLPDRHPQQEMFLCDISDAVLKDDMASMEHPFFTLSKKPDTAIRKYEHNGNKLEVTPSVKGLATIYDKDVLIYAISQLVAAKNAGEQISKRIQVSARSLLIFTNKETGGRNYKLLIESLERLQGTQIKTNIKTGGTVQERIFSLIDEADIVRDEKTDRIVQLNITLSDWAFNAIDAEEVLTLHSDYFRLKKPLERRVYELARKHCGQQKTWRIGMELLHKKSGSNSPIKHFRHMMKKLIVTDHLPDYRVDLEEDMVVFTFRKAEELAKQARAETSMVRLSGEAYHDARQVAPGWDVYFLEEQWRGMMSMMDTRPKKPDAAFVGFCRKWFEKRGTPS